MKKKFILIFSFFLLTGGLYSSATLAGEITYQPINPNFGGNPFNAPPLLNSANAQNGFRDPASIRAPRVPLTSAQRFAQRLDSAVLSRLTRLLAGQVVDTNGDLVTGGTINTGINTIDVIETGTGTVIQITDLVTGEVTTINIPDIQP